MTPADLAALAALAIAASLLIAVFALTCALNRAAVAIGEWTARLGELFPADEEEPDPDDGEAKPEPVANLRVVGRR